MALQRLLSDYFEDDDAFLSYLYLFILYFLALKSILKTLKHQWENHVLLFLLSFVEVVRRLNFTRNRFNEEANYIEQHNRQL